MDEFYKRKDIDKNTVEITVTIPKDSFKKSYDALLKDQLKKTDLKGFRKGKVPTDLIEPEISNTVKIEAFEKLVPLYLTTALQKENLSPVAPPNYKSFPDFSKDEDLTFSVDITVMPEFKLGNLKKIKVNIETNSVSKKEIDDAIQNVFKNTNLGEKEVNDKWAKGISKTLQLEKIESLTDLQKYVKDTLTKQKEIVARRKAEDDAFGQAIALCKIEVPQTAIDYEAHEREHSFVHEMGHDDKKVEQFLKANNITMERMRELWLKDAKQALESDIFLKLYAKEREIKVTDEDLAKKVELLKKGAPQGTDPSLFENEEWKEYVRRVEEKEIAFKAFTEEVFGK